MHTDSPEKSKSPGMCLVFVGVIVCALLCLNGCLLKQGDSAVKVPPGNI